MLDSLLRGWNDFKDFNILNFSKILFAIEFSIVFKIFEYLLSFSEFSNHYCANETL